ncbi:MAG TPA: 3-oxoacyl-[acyl-carrier-protein] synthase III C-terminal domain-containing protein [Burkholderiales bacterium]
MHISGLGTAVPAACYTQAQCWDALQETPQFGQLDRRARAMLQKVLLGDSGIETRHLALDPLAEVFDNHPDVLHARYARHAPLLASRAAVQALEESGVRACDIDAVLISTCTGYLCPGLTSYVSERLGLGSGVLALDLVGQGCGAALPNLAAADALLASGRCEAVLSICVEVCSAAYYLDNDPGVLVSACLFADGAGAAVLTATPLPRTRSVEWVASASLHATHERDALRFEQREGLLRNVLTPQVPRLAAEYARRVLDDMLPRARVPRAAIDTWVWHAGGKRVLEAVREALELEPEDMAVSREALRAYGNMSSACVYFVLKRALRERLHGGWWWMSSFGAGFSCHGALLRVAGG